MRYLLDTCIMLYMVNKTGEMSDDVEAIVNDYGNQLYMSAASIRELSGAWHKYERMQKRFPAFQTVLDLLRDQFSIETLYPQHEHYNTFSHLKWNLDEDHRDTTDILIIAHAITERLTLISSDRKFKFYENQGLKFVYNKKPKSNS